MSSDVLDRDMDISLCLGFASMASTGLQCMVDVADLQTSLTYWVSRTAAGKNYMLAWMCLLGRGTFVWLALV